MNCFMCPLSKKPLQDPVVAADGYTYEKSVIEAYLKAGKKESPITGEEMTDDTLIPNKTLKSLILNKSTDKLQQLAQKYIEMKSENIASVRKELKQSDILENLKKIDEIIKSYKENKIDADNCLKYLDPYVKFLPEDDELLQEYILLAYWTRQYSKAQYAIDILSKNSLYDMIGPLLKVHEKSFDNLDIALQMYKSIEASREPNLFRVRDLKYKAIALQSIGLLQDAIKHYNAYEVFVPYDPSIYALFKAKALKEAGMAKELRNYQVDYYLKYGNFEELCKIK